jgi:hypothetical protein
MGWGEGYGGADGEIVAEDTPNNQGQSQRPAVVYETEKMTSEQIAQTNATYRAMGLNCMVIDVSLFGAKHELQSDGTYKRTLIRRSRKQQ